MRIKNRVRMLTIYFIVIFLFFALIFRIIEASAKNVEDSLGIKVPIIMYHSVLKDPSKSNDYVISPIDVEKDFIYLKDNNYTTVFISDLINYVYDDIPLPKNPVVITFDDGQLNNLEYVLPLLKKYDMKANFSVVGDYTEKWSMLEDKNLTYSYLTWPDIKTLVESGRVEIGNHSNKMHSIDSKRKASTINEGETYKDYLMEFGSDTMAVQNKLHKNSDVTPQFYTYPYGFYCAESEKILKSLNFKATLIVSEKPNYITKSPECLYLLNRYNRPSGISTNEFMNKALA